MNKIISLNHMVQALKQPNGNTYEQIQEAIMELKDKISSSKIMNTEPHMVSLLPSNDSIVDKRNPRHCKIKKQLQLRPEGQGWGRGRGRSYKLDGSSHQHNEQLVDSSSEESPGCIMGETAALQLEPQMSWNRLVYGGITSQMEDSLSSMNGLEDKPQQHMNKGGPKRKLNLDGKTECEHLEQKSSKRRCRGRPPNPGSTEDCSWSWVPVVPSNNCIHSGKKPNFWNIVEHKKLQSPQDQAQVDINPSCDQTQMMGPKLKSDADGSCQKQMVLPRSASQVRRRRELLQLKLSNAYKTISSYHLKHVKSQRKHLLRSSLTQSRLGASKPCNGARGKNNDVICDTCLN